MAIQSLLDDVFQIAASKALDKKQKRENFLFMAGLSNRNIWKVGDFFVLLRINSADQEDSKDMLWVFQISGIYILKYVKNK